MRLSTRPVRVVAVVCTYWPNRQQNTRQIVADLQASTRPPDRIIVLNNNTEILFEDRTDGSCDTINMPFNSECRGKFLAGLLDLADYYLLLDDDTSVGPETIEALLRSAHRDICTGYLGCWIDPDEHGDPSFWKGRRLWPHDAEVETRCDAFCGCAMFVSFKALVKMLVLEERVRLRGEWTTEGDDILVGLANKSTVVPLHGAEKFVDLGYQGQAMCLSIEGYMEMRDRFTRDVLADLQGQPMPEF